MSQEEVSKKSMNIILIEEHEIVGNQVELTDHRAKHIVKVLKSRVGEQLRLGVINGEMGVATVLAVTIKYPFAVSLQVELQEKPVSGTNIDLLLALPRPIMLKRILSQMAALGVGTIYIVNANRVEKSFWESGILTEDEYRPHLLHGLEQAVDTRLPEIHIRRRFRPFVEDELSQIAPAYSHLLLAHPTAKNSLSACMAGGHGRLLYAVGPEGGWVDFEVEKLVDAGMQVFSMGQRILKVDTATVAIHSRIVQQLEHR